jgi:aminotransferase in exopolysaccharide biosynthesis
VFSSIPLSVPVLRGNEWRYVKDCLDSGWVSSAGKYVDRFEEMIGDLTGARYTVACASGTAALQVALELAGVEAGDEVIVPTVTFIAPVNAVRYVRAEPVFMDCDAFYNIDREKTVRFLREETRFKNGATFNKRTGARIRALLPVHVFGNAVDLAGLVGICADRNIKIVEDAAESLGTVYKAGPYKGRHTGTVGEIGCLSFNGNKIITTGGGGAMVTNSRRIARQAKYLVTQAKDNAVHYIHHRVGYNFRLSNLQAATGVGQLEGLARVQEIKRRNFRIYKEKIDRIAGLRIAGGPPFADNNHWMYALQIDKSRYGRGRRELMRLFRREGIEVRPLFYLNHLQKPYRHCQTYSIEAASKMLEGTLNIPCSADLKKTDINRIVGLLRKWKKSL